MGVMTKKRQTNPLVNGFDPLADLLCQAIRHGQVWESRAATKILDDIGICVPVSPVNYIQLKGDFQVTRCCNCLSNYMISAMSGKHPASCGCSIVSPTLGEDISVVKPYQARRASDGSQCEAFQTP